MGIARVTSYGAGKAEFTGLEPNEVDMMLAASMGVAWVKVDELGRVEKRNVFAPLPTPTDVNMEPFWRKNQEVQIPLLLDDFEPLPNHHDPSISIQHLCGYNYTPENYKREAETFDSVGI